MALPACLCGEGLQGGEALSLLAGTTTLAGSGGCRLVDRSVAAHPGDHLGAGQPDRGERGKGTVAAEHEAVLRKPPRHLLQHGLGQLVVGRPAFAEQPHVDGQPKGLASPRRTDPKGEHHQVEPQRVDQALVGGADGVTEVPRSLHLAARLVEQGVVDVQAEHPRPGVDGPDRRRGDRFPDQLRAPGAGPEEAMVGVVGTASLRIGDADQAGDRVAGRAAHPGGHKV